MELGLDLKQTQTLSPQMMQAMEILQMGSQELLEYIQEAVQENPVLEAEDTRQPQESPEDALLRRKLEWLASTDVQNRWYHQEDAQDLSDLAVGATGADPGEESLYYYLRAQVRFEQLPEPLARAVECVLESLNGNGWLDEPEADLATHAGVDEGVIRQAVELVQALEPPGVAARTLSECLVLQLDRRGEHGLPMTIARDYLEAMGRDRYNLIARATGASREEIQAACQVIRSLDPRPGASFAPREALGYITPDLVVVSFEDHFEILANDYFFPTLKVSAYYHQLMRTTDEAQVRQAVDLLVEQWPIVQAYVMDDIFQKLEGANAYVGTYYYGDYLTMYENNPDLGFYIPEEGTNIYVDAMCILKDAPNKANAEAFINYMCSTQAGLKNCEAIWYSSPLLSVREELDPDIADDPYAYPDDSIMAKCESYAGLPQNILDLYDSEWIRLKTTTGGQFWGLF